MGAREPPQIARLRWLARVSLVYAVALVLLLQGYAILRGVVTGSIFDPWLAVVPVLWFDIALIGLLLFLWGLSFGGGPSGRGGWRSWFVPEFGAIRSALRSKSLRAWIFGAGVGYAVLISTLTGVTVIDPAGTAPSGPSGYPFFDVFEGPLGWGPKVVWAPNPYFVVLLRPYTAAVTALLALLAAFGIGLIGYLRSGARSKSVRGRGAAGGAAGLLVMCPACAASPTFALFAGLLVPAAAGESAAAAGLAVGPVMAFSTAMLLVSVVLLWAGITRTSRALSGFNTATVSGASSLYERRKALARWALAAAVVLAVGALLLDLSVAPPPAAHAIGGHGTQVLPTGPTGHPPFAIGLAFAGTILAALGVIFTRPAVSGTRGLGLVAGLALLYADGIVHWFAILEHLGEPASALFFLATGAVQVAAVPLALRGERILWWVGVALTAFLVVLFAVTRLVPTPFALVLEPAEPLGLLSKGLEAGILGAMGAFFGRRIIPWGARKVAAGG